PGGLLLAAAPANGLAAAQATVAQLQDLTQRTPISAAGQSQVSVALPSILQTLTIGDTVGQASTTATWQQLQPFVGEADGAARTIALLNGGFVLLTPQSAQAAGSVAPINLTDVVTLDLGSGGG